MNAKPRLGVAVLVEDVVGRLLLGKRAKRPNQGKWVIPGGGVKFGETLIETAKREIKEEAGIEIRLYTNSHPIIIEIITDDEHRVIMFLQANRGHGALRAGDDLMEADFFHKSEIRGLDLSPVIVPVLRETGWLPRM